MTVDNAKIIEEVNRIVQKVADTKKKELVIMYHEQLRGMVILLSWMGMEQDNPELFNMVDTALKQAAKKRTVFE